MIKKILLSFLILIPTFAFALANPASVNCIAKHHQLLLIQETGICVFANHSYCEEWSYFRNECKQDKFYWPEKKIAVNNLKKYCIAKNKNQSLVILCKQQQ